MFGRSAIPLLCVLGLTGLLLTACTNSDSSPEEALVRATIQRYDTLLAQGYRTMNMGPMREVATQLQAEAEYIHMASLGEGGVRLLPELKSLEFGKVSIESTRATAETRETWDYTHESVQTGKVLLVQPGQRYVLAWDLEKQANGRWLVSDVRAISSTSTVQPTRVATPTPVSPAP